jgi:hypothetical protein
MNVEFSGTVGKRSTGQLFSFQAKKRVCDEVRAREKQRVDDLNSRGTNAPNL